MAWTWIGRGGAPDERLRRSHRWCPLASNAVGSATTRAPQFGHGVLTQPFLYLSPPSVTSPASAAEGDRSTVVPTHPMASSDLRGASSTRPRAPRRRARSGSGRAPTATFRPASVLRAQWGLNREPADEEADAGGFAARIGVAWCAPWDLNPEPADEEADAGGFAARIGVAWCAPWDLNPEPAD
jgi:hypothetical protein